MTYPLTERLDALEAEARRDHEDDYPLSRVPPDTVLALVEVVRAASWMEHPSPAVKMALARLAKALEGR